VAARKDSQAVGEIRLNGSVIIGELVRNMELGQFEMNYSILLPCIFSLYLHPDDYSRLSGVIDLIIDDAKRALRARVAQLNTRPTILGLKRPGSQSKEYKIACRDWVIEFFPDTEGTVPLGDVEVHSDLNEALQPGFRGTKTTLMDRDPSVTTQRTAAAAIEVRRPPEKIYAEIHYEDDSGPQVYLVTQNLVRIGRGGGNLSIDLALYTNDEVSREHLILRRDAATGQFLITDKSANGVWIDGKRLKKDVEEALADRAQIGVGEVLTLAFEVRR
jgi:FHA domain